MRFLKDAETKEAAKWLDKAAEVARKSPCLRAHCGAVIVKGGEVVGFGFNSPPRNNPAYRTCLDEYDIPAGFRHDRTCCIHAEQRAIADALVKNQLKLKDAKIYFTHVDLESGEKLKSGNIKCTICSRAVLDAGITDFILEFEDGIRDYDADEFNRLSYEYKTPKVRL